MSNQNTAEKTLRPCEACDRPEHLFRGMSGPPRCLSCHLLCDDAIDAGISCNDIAANMHATVGIGSDSYAATVVRVTRDTEIKSVTVRFERSGEEVTFTRRKKGDFKPLRAQRSGYYLSLGKRTEHRSPEF